VAEIFLLGLVADETWGSRDLFAGVSFSPTGCEPAVSSLCVDVVVTMLCVTVSITPRSSQPQPPSGYFHMHHLSYSHSRHRCLLLVTFIRIIFPTLILDTVVDDLLEYQVRVGLTMISARCVVTLSVTPVSYMYLPHNMIIKYGDCKKK
ncbi:hypothetical protein Tco_1481839, partial [Tanacetum coccineum]